MRYLSEEWLCQLLIGLYSTLKGLRPKILRRSLWIIKWRLRQFLSYSGRNTFIDGYQELFFANLIFSTLSEWRKRPSKSWWERLLSKFTQNLSTQEFFWSRSCSTLPELHEACLWQTTFLRYREWVYGYKLIPKMVAELTKGEHFSIV